MGKAFTKFYFFQILIESEKRVWNGVIALLLDTHLESIAARSYFFHSTFANCVKCKMLKLAKWSKL